MLPFVPILAMLLLSEPSRAAEPPPTPFGINGCSWSHVGLNTENFDRQGGLKRLRVLKEAGVQWDRCDLWWGRIEPEKGTFRWDDLDWVVAQYRDAGVQLMPILCYGSAWKSDAPVTDEERALYGRYVFQMVSRYKDDIHVWEIWNEPNITPFWTPRPDANDYAKLLKVAYEQAKEADPDCVVVGASTAGADLPFIETLLRAGGGQWMDAISIHPYQGDLGSLSPDKGGLETHIRDVRKLLVKYDCPMPIQLTEIGHRTTGTHGHTEVTEDQQAAYLVRTHVIALANGVERVFWFNLQDWDEYWGIVRKDFSRKPSFEAYQTMVKHLDNKRAVGRVDLGDGVSAFLFAPADQEPTRDNTVLVAWRPDDGESPSPIKSDEVRAIGMMPVFWTDLTNSDFSIDRVLPLDE